MPASQRRKRSRLWMTIGAAALVALLLAWAFWPRAVPVDFGEVVRGEMMVTIDEEARTRVRDAYVVSAPIAGRLMRVEVEPGDEVVGGETIIARMLAAAPSALDLRTREQARAGVNAAEAGLRVARADLNSALAQQDLADSEYSRLRPLVEGGAVSQSQLDQSERAKRSADAAVDTAQAAISMREAELANARARLISFDDSSLKLESGLSDGEFIPLTAPISGRILRVIQESETTVAAGQTVLEIGDVSNDLEVICELLSTDAVQVRPGDKVIIDNWGGDAPLEGVVDRVDPWGFTKFSALGVEEQRVYTIVRFIAPLEERATLGHGYRVEARFVTWQEDNTLIAPSSALFRFDGGWAVFVVDDNEARLTSVEVAQNNGVQAAISTGLNEGQTVVLFPGAGLKDGLRVVQREVED